MSTSNLTNTLDSLVLLVLPSGFEIDCLLLIDEPPEACETGREIG